MVLELAAGPEAREEGLVQGSPVEMRNAIGPDRPWRVFCAEAAAAYLAELRNRWARTVLEWAAPREVKDALGGEQRRSPPQPDPKGSWGLR